MFRVTPWRARSQPRSWAAAGVTVGVRQALVRKAIAEQWPASGVAGVVTHLAIFHEAARRFEPRAIEARRAGMKPALRSCPCTSLAGERARRLLACCADSVRRQVSRNGGARRLYLTLDASNHRVQPTLPVQRPGAVLGHDVRIGCCELRIAAGRPL